MHVVLKWFKFSDDVFSRSRKRLSTPLLLHFCRISKALDYKCANFIMLLSFASQQ